MRPIWTALASLSLVCAVAPGHASRRVEVHLFGGDITDGAPLAPWYREIGITDVWLYTLKGAFPQDQAPETQRSVADLQAGGVLDAYRTNGIRYWWFERPVPDVLYTQANCLWDDAPAADAAWQGVCERVAEIYPQVRAAGFEGLAYDNEAYYSYQGDEQGDTKPWVWGGHADEYGLQGGYHRRGLQVGKAIHAVWPRAKVIMVYAFGYEGERWWYQGFADAGLRVYLGAEHTYGAGPGDLGGEWYQSWWQGRKTKATCDWKRTRFPFLKSNERVIAGLFPIDFGARKPNYRAADFRAQLDSAANDDPDGPIPVWLWPQGPFTPESWDAVTYADDETAWDYLDALREFGRTKLGTGTNFGRTSCPKLVPVPNFVLTLPPCPLSPHSSPSSVPAWAPAWPPSCRRALRGCASAARAPRGRGPQRPRRRRAGLGPGR